MSYKLKHDSIDVFCKEMASEVCDLFFKENESIDGNQLMSITGSKQTNLFLVKALFEKWQQEIKKLESPFFDFKEPEVQDALSTFMKVLSKYIKVERPDLEPLMKKALSDSLQLHFQPEQYFSNEIFSGSDKELRIADLAELKKYLKVNSTPFFSILKGSENNVISQTDLVERIKETYSEASLDDFDPKGFLGELNALERLTDLFEEEVVQEAPVPESEIELPPIEIENEPKATDSSALNEKFTKSKKTLADQLQKKVLKDIDSSLSLNERIMFINSLFGGDKDEFKSALKDLEASSNIDDAKSKVKTQYGADWDLETEEAEAFLEVLERRFA